MNFLKSLTRLICSDIFCMEHLRESSVHRPCYLSALHVAASTWKGIQCQTARLEIDKVAPASVYTLRDRFSCIFSSSWGGFLDAGKSALYFAPTLKQEVNRFICQLLFNKKPTLFICQRHRLLKSHCAVCFRSKHGCCVGKAWGPGAGPCASLLMSLYTHLKILCCTIQ